MPGQTTDRQQDAETLPPQMDGGTQDQSADAGLRDAAAGANLADGQAATKPKPELGDGPVAGEEAWIVGAMKYNRLRDYRASQWTAIQRSLQTGDDGIPGRSTARAIYRWQKANGIEPDGKLGPSTYIALKGSVPIPKPRPDDLVEETTGDVEPEKGEKDPEKPSEGQTQEGEQQQAKDSDTDAANKPAEGEQAKKDKKRDPSFQEDRVKYLQVLDQVTSVMETGTRKGDYSLLHTKADGGGISYGKHQVTLTSGTLYKLLATYVEVANAKSPNLPIIKQRLARTKKMDGSLRGDQAFLNALRQAGAEKEMKQAQDMVFMEHYGKKAFDAAEDGKIKSVLGMAILYDTKIQGGMETLLKRAENKVGGKIGDEVEGRKITEREFLMAFNDKREERLMAIAAGARKKGKHTRANMLENSTYRTKSFRELLEAGNLNIAGPDGKVDIKGPGGGTYEIEGFDDKEVKGATAAEEIAKLPTIGNAVITASKLNVRRAPNRDARRIDQVEEGEEFEVVEQKSGWLKLKLHTKVGWISGDYANFSPAEKDAAEQATQD